VDKLLRAVDKRVVYIAARIPPDSMLTKGGERSERKDRIGYPPSAGDYPQAKRRRFRFSKMPVIQISTPLITIILFTFFNRMMIISFFGKYKN